MINAVSFRTKLVLLSLPRSSRNIFAYQVVPAAGEEAGD